MFRDIGQRFLGDAVERQPDRSRYLVVSGVGAGLLLDTLIVRTFLMPSLVALLGRWFWWPYLIGTRVRAPANSATRRVRSAVSA
jgi:uncharacterized membrane protein YdfJ with MMPL/SSD domain